MTTEENIYNLLTSCKEITLVKCDLTTDSKGKKLDVKYEYNGKNHSKYFHAKNLECLKKIIKEQFNV